MSALTRRGFLAAATGALVIGVALPARAQQIRRMSPDAIRDLPAAPKAFLRIDAEGIVTVIAKHVEFGQGAHAGLAMLAAEELDADWSAVRVEDAPADVALYANLNLGFQGTTGSSSIRGSWVQMRKAGAAARAMLVAAAAEAWDVPEAQIEVARGVIRHPPSGRESGFGPFAAHAAQMPFPDQPRLKDPAAFTLIGTDLPRPDLIAKTSGAAVYAIDVTRPGMVESAILHPPVFGATLRGFDPRAAEAIPGVLGLRQVPQGLAVYARTRFAALQGVEALEADWDRAGAETRSSAQMFRDYAAAARTPGAEAEARGDAAAALAAAAQVLEAEFRFPFLAHAPMAPACAVVERHAEGATLWMGSQMPTVDQAAAARALGLPPDQVAIRTTYSGGSFGRTGTLDGDFAAEAAAVAAAWDGAPVKHLWSRETDMRAGRWRPMAVHRLRGGIDAAGRIAGWNQVIAVQSWLQGTPYAGLIRNGIDRSAVAGAAGMPYAIPDRRIGLHLMPNGVPANYFRSVAHNHTCFAVECFLDELLALGGRDAVEGRIALLGEDKARLSACLSRVAQMADWGGAPPEGRARGVAAVEAFGTSVAQIVEVSRGDNGLPRAERVWAAVDCGIAISPDLVRAQIEGGIGHALSVALYGEMSLAEGGAVEQSNFDDAPALRIEEAPRIEISILPSRRDPTGAGEPGFPPLAPAMANAWAALAGRRIRAQPFARRARG